MSSSFKVLEAYKNDVGRGLARIDYDSIDALVPPVRMGDSMNMAVEIRSTSGSSTFAKIVPLQPRDEAKGIVRIDKFSKGNAGISLGDSAEIRRVRTYKAEGVNLVPMQPTPPMLHPSHFSNTWETLLIKVGDTVHLPFYDRDRNLSFKVVKIIPPEKKGAAIVYRGTAFVY